MTNTKCIVTLTIGSNFENSWREICFKNWQEYASKYGYDLIVLSQPLDTSFRANSRSPAWQKCLVLSAPEVKNYRQAVWIDADILINNSLAPDICSLVAEERIGGVQDFSYPTKEIHRYILERKYANWKRLGIQYVDNISPYLFYKNYGIESDFDEVFQTGVFVASPKHHS